MAAVVTGGATRAESVRLALAEVPDDALVVLVHDAARPLVDDAVVERVLAPLAEGCGRRRPRCCRRRHGEARRTAGIVAETVDRDALVAVQTPQAFVADRLRAAYRGELDGRTDCAVARRAAGGRVAVVAGDPRLVKVTTADDLELVARLVEDDGCERAGGLLRRRRDARRRGALLACRAPSGRARPARRMGGARRDDRPGRGALGALAASRRRAACRRMGLGRLLDRTTSTPTRSPCLAARCARRGCSSASPGTRHAALEDGHARRTLPVDVVTGSSSLGVSRSPTPAFFERGRRARRRTRRARSPMSATGSTTTSCRRSPRARRRPHPPRPVGHAPATPPGAIAIELARRAPGGVARA